MTTTATAEPSLSLSLSTLASRTGEDGRLVVAVGRHAVRLEAAPWVATVLQALEDGVAEAPLRARAMEAGGVQGLYRLQQLLERLDAVGAVRRALVLDGEELIALEPLSPRCPEPGALPEGTVLLSRFAVARREGDALRVECPLGHGRLTLDGPGAAPLLASLVAGTDIAGLAGALGCDEEAAGRALALAAAAGALTTVEEDGVAGEDRRSEARTWEVHDLLFHARSRLGRHAGGYGGTFRFRGELPEPPVLKAAMSDDPVALPRPDLDALRRDDLPFTEVMERRASIREHGEEPLTLEELGGFLFRAARVKEHLKNEHGEVARRIYPGGGALYELEIYAVVDRCRGLDSGLYRYDPLGHALEPVAGRTPAVEALLTQAFHTADGRSPPHVLLAITARFPRMQWKYEGMAYAAILKHVGVVFQTFYLVATAMGLAPCALGGGDSDLFAEAGGLDWLRETTVGEFVLGAPERDR